jgi:hypothetical protein
VNSYKIKVTIYERMWYLLFIGWRMTVITLENECNQAEMFEMMNRVRELLPENDWRRVVTLELV